MAKNKLILDFTQDLVERPIIYRLAADHRLEMNILRASVTEDGGRIILHLEGKEDAISAGIRYLREKGVSVRDLNGYISKDDERCTDCGACVSICPTLAYELNREDFKVVHVPDRCIACGLCLDICPTKAIKVVV